MKCAKCDALGGRGEMHGYVTHLCNNHWNECTKTLLNHPVVLNKEIARKELDAAIARGGDVRRLTMTWMKLAEDCFGIVEKWVNGQ